MSLVLDKDKQQITPFLVDRPAWIPDHILDGWDTSPYAYQTEEEQMPAGGPHGRLLSYIFALVSYLIEPKGLMFLPDTFMLYRDKGKGRKKRVGPDLLLMPYRDEAPSAYDLDVEPPPLMVVEITSPDSHLNDLAKKNGFYLGLGIPTYLVIDAIQPNSKFRDPIELHLWRIIDGHMRKMDADLDGYLTLPEMGFSILARGRELFFKNSETGEVARDAGSLAETLERQLAALEEERRVKEEERQARLQVEKENAELRAEIERLRRAQGM